MHWHAELTLELRLLAGPGEWIEFKRATLRGYLQPGGYEERRQFDAIVQADIMGARAFMHGALRRDGAPLGRRDWRDIARLLSSEFGVLTGIADRHGREVAMSAERWASL